MRVLLIFSLLMFGYNHSFSQTYGNYNYGKNYKVFLGKTAKLDVSGELNSPVQDKLYNSIPKGDFDFESRVEDVLKYKNVEFLVDSIFGFQDENEFNERDKRKLIKLTSLSHGEHDHDCTH